MRQWGVEFMRRYQKVFAICGMIAPIVYAMIWILGGILQPEYSHIRDDVSSLLAVGAPNKLLFDAMDIVYVLLMIVFFSSLHWAINKGKGLILGPALLLTGSLIGLPIPLFFPLDAGGEIITFVARVHVILVMLMAFVTLAGILAMWLRLRKVDQWKGYGTYSLITFMVSLVLGLVAVRTVGTEIMGLTERLVATSVGQYVFVIALRAYRTSE